ncbi:reverse transcriptase domain-containing protein [Tanacetum coccineum]|uniref:Reverse transcriptase domain-containing protein n=1 Tax=Tanacetum coccineum TaxID=301880 RepID=A0ABQ5I7I1_9ASTR
MFNSTLTGNARVWFDKLPKESIDSYEDLRTAFRENYLQQTKHIKDPVEIHHIKQRDGESTEDFMERYKAEGKLLHSVTAGEKHPHHGNNQRGRGGGDKPNFKKGFKNKQRPDRKPDRFSLLTKTPKEIFALEKGKFKAPPPMVTPAEKRDPNKYCEFHSDTGHNTDECMQLRKQIDEMIKSGKLSQFIRELKQNDKPKAPKKGEASGKDKPLAILMIQPWERVAKPRITQSFSPETAISFPPLGKEDGTEGPMIIEAHEMAGKLVRLVYVDGGASSEVLYEHCFVKLRKEIRDQMVSATTHLIGFSGETIWPLGQIALLVKIGDEVHSTSAWMNFMIIRSPSQHNAIIGRPGIRKIRAVPSTAHGMLKFPVEGGTMPTFKEAGQQSTYMDKAFQRQIGRNLEVYVDDLVIKSRTEEEIIRDITETFKTLRQINMKLNPKKCTFGMQEGIFGLPGEIISDNGKQFRDNPFKDWCEKLCIRQCFASVKHPQRVAKLKDKQKL